MSNEERGPAPAASRVFALSGALAAAAGALTLTRVAAAPRPEHGLAAFVLLVAAFSLTEIFPVHFEHRREALSFSLSSIPMVVGLFTLGPLVLVAARVLGAGLALVLHRRQQLFKLALNLSMFWLDIAVAITVFTLLRPAGAFGPTAWIAAFGAAIASDFVSSIVLITAISLYQRVWEEGLVSSLLVGSLASMVDTCAGILVVTLLVAEPAALALLAVIVAMLLASYRVYSSLREKHANLAHLYDFTSEMGRAVLDGRVLHALLEQTRELMHAEHAWLYLLQPDGKTIRVGLDDADGTLVDQTDEQGAGDADAGIDEPRLLPARDGMAAPLVGPTGRLGTLLVHERSGAVRQFGAEDLRLFATLANHASVSLGNSQLVDQLRENAAIAEHASLHDALTGLPNRVLFQRRVQARLERGGTAAVLLLDLDRFQEVNDTLGHPNGDALLCEVGVRIRTALRGGDLIARLGGDEFAVLLPDIANDEAAVHAARGIAAALERPFAIADVSVAVSASIGVAVAPDHGDNPTLLLQRADVAMYTAKGDQTGVELYQLSRDAHTTQALGLVGELRGAISSGTLDVHYQPQIDLSSGRVMGAEALVRWIHPNRGFIPPDEFIPVAEQSGLIGPLTRLVLQRALAECAAWRDAGHPVRVSVNLSARSLLQATLPDEVAELLADAGVDPTLLCLELTETSMMVDPRRTVETLQRLRALGVTIAIDDFGTGHSSLAYLKQLPVGEIKIDKSFVLGMCNDRFDEAIVCSIVDLARHLLVPVVAEGVENAAIEARLQAAGCSFGQGYGFCRPIPPAAFKQWLADVAKGRRVTADAA